MARSVETYSGYRADERPTRFEFEGRMVEVRRILRRWREPDAECFRVLGDDSQSYVLSQERDQGGWIITRGDESAHSPAE